MAGILNKTARQFNLKCMTAGKRRVTIRVAPGFNSVDDDHWKAFTHQGKDGAKKLDPYVKELKEKSHIDFGAKVDDMELDREPDTKSKSKSVAAPKPAKQAKDE